MSQLSGLSDSRPSSWRSRRLSPPDSRRDWQRSACSETHTSAQREQNHIMDNCWREPLFADLTAAGDEDRHRHSDVSVWEDGQRHQGVHQHASGVWGSISFSRDVLLFICSFASHCMFLCVQFLHGRGLKQVDVKTIQCVSVGQKDQNKGLFHLWQEIFQLPRTKRYRASRHRINHVETKNRVLEQNHCLEWWAWNFSFFLQPVESNYHLFSAAFPVSERLKILGKFNRNLNSCNALIPKCWLDLI